MAWRRSNPRGGRWPVSFLGLAWAALLAVALPFGGALVGAGWWAADLAREAAEGLEETALQGAWSRRLEDNLLALERKARQLVVLGDAEILADYEARRGEVLEVLARLEGAAPAEAVRRELARIREIEAGVYARLVAGPIPPGEVGGALARFGEAHAAARAVTNGVQERVERWAEETRQEAEGLRRRLWGLAMGAIPLTLGLAALFAVLLSRPVRSLEAEVERLGEGAFERPVEIRGPADLANLGERLDRMRRRLLELESEKTRFLAHLSHDLKTPLTAIREGAELLLGGVAGDLDPEQEEVVRIVRENGIQLQRQIENLLAFSLGDARDRTEPWETVDLAEVVRQVIEDLQPACRARGLRLESQIEPVSVEGVRRRLRSVVENLLSNAVKFTPDGGRILLRLEARGDRAVLEVHDSGPGIRPEERQRVFEAFYQGGARGAGPVKGSGLGLAIVKEYVEAHRGAVELCPSPLGGAGFRVTLPVRQG